MYPYCKLSFFFLLQSKVSCKISSTFLKQTLEQVVLYQTNLIFCQSSQNITTYFPIVSLPNTCLEHSQSMLSKGQLISKCPFVIFNSSKKRMKKFNLTTMIPQIDLFSFIFLEEFEETKKTF